MKSLRVILPCILTGAAGFLAGRQGTDPGSRSGSNLPVSSSTRESDKTGNGNAQERRSRDKSTEHRQVGIASAMKGALGHSLEGKRLEKWMDLLSTMRSEDGPAIAALLHEEWLAGRNFGVEAMAFWQSWASIDGRAAWTYAQEHPDAGGRGGAESILKAWAFADPQAAMASFRELGDSPLAGSALAGLAHGLAESDPAAAVEFASTLPGEKQTETAVHVAGSLIHAMGNEGAEAWFDKLPSDTPIFNKEASRVMMESLSRSDPGSVEKFAFARLDQEWSKRPAEQNFAASMILRNGGSPWEYVATVMEKYPRPEEPLALTTWVARLNPASAITWADSNPDHPAADKILAGAIRAYRQRGAADEAGALLDRIKEPSVRTLAEQE